MVNIQSVWARLPEGIRERAREIYERLKGQYNRIDLALVKAFQEALRGGESESTGADATRVKVYNEITADASPTLLGEDANFWYRRVVLTTEGVNLNRQLKPREELEKTAELQADHLIPSVNDHPEDPEGLRVHPKDDEVSGFVFGIRGEEGKDGRYRLVGIDAIPKDRPELLTVRGVSIGYLADMEFRPGEYKGAEYDAIQRNITLVHLARMVKQHPSCPPAISEGKVPPGLAVGCGYDAQKNGGECTSGEDGNENEEDAEWSRKFINDLPDAAFAYIEPGGKKDEEGKTVPRSLRHFPHHGPNVKTGTEHTTVDLPHLRNALARLPQSSLPDAAKAKARAHLVRHAKALGVGNYDEEENDMSDDEKGKNEAGQKPGKDDEDRQAALLAETARALADAKAALEAKEKELADLKEEHEKVKEELQALKDQIRASLLKALDEAYPGVFTEEDKKEMRDCEIRRLLKARTGQDHQPVIVVQEAGADNDDQKTAGDDSGWTVGVPGKAGWEI